MKFVFDDSGRAARYKGIAGDSCTRCAQTNLDKTGGFNE